MEFLKCVSIGTSGQFKNMAHFHLSPVRTPTVHFNYMIAVLRAEYMRHASYRSIIHHLLKAPGECTGTDVADMAAISLG